MCFSRLLWFESYILVVHRSQLHLTFFHCQRRDTPSSGLMCLWPCRRSLVRFFHPPQESDRHPSLKGAWKSWWRVLLGDKMAYSCRGFIGSTPSECQSPTRFGNPETFIFPTGIRVGGIWRSWKNTFNGVCQSSCLSKQRPGNNTFPVDVVKKLGNFSFNKTGEFLGNPSWKLTYPFPKVRDVFSPPEFCYTFFCLCWPSESVEIQTRYLEDTFFF